MSDDLKPIQNGDTICIFGGGPGGSGCAIALKKEAEKLGKNIRVVIFEQKKFQEHRQFNQCIGVLSPPLENILRENLGLEFPSSLIKKEIKRYCLHSDNMSLNLKGDEGGKSYAVNRSKFDAFMMLKAEEAGTEIVHNKVTAVEINDQDVLVYSEGENCRAAAVVGAFGLDDGSCKVFEQATPYKQPDFLNTVITRIYPGEDFLQEMGPTVHAFLLSYNGLEFGAITPKDDHLSINVAGRKVSSQVMLEFLRSAPVQRFLPEHKRRENPLNYFRGKFPIGPAKNLFGRRYVTIGDAAGLIRPYKGKGINSACLTGVYAAKTIINHGVSEKAFEIFIKECKELTQDLPYGRVLRWMTKLSLNFEFMDHLLKIGKDDPIFMDCLFNSVSGHKPYKQIFLETATPSVGLKMAREAIDRFILNKRLKS